MRLLTRSRLVTLAFVVGFVAVLAGIGAVTRSSSSPQLTATAPASTGPGTAPSALWYWTMAVSPTDGSTLVLGTSGGLYRSTDGGKTWKATGPKKLNATSVVQSGSTLYAGGGRLGSTGSPVVKKGAARSASDGASVLVMSADGGTTWKQLHPRGLPNAAIQALAVDPAASSSLYVLLTTGALYRSTDGARSFTAANPRLRIPPWAIALTDNGHFVGGDMDTGPYTSPTGTAWKPTSFTDSRGGKMVMEYAVQPKNVTKILMSSFGLEISTDGGQTWKVALRSDVMFGPVAWSSSATDTAYAVGFDGSVWHTSDGGTTWNEVK